MLIKINNQLIKMLKKFLKIQTMQIKHQKYYLKKKFLWKNWIQFQKIEQSLNKKVINLQNRKLWLLLTKSPIKFLNWLDKTKKKMIPYLIRKYQPQQTNNKT